MKRYTELLYQFISIYIWCAKPWAFEGSPDRPCLRQDETTVVCCEEVQ